MADDLDPAQGPDFDPAADFGRDYGGAIDSVSPGDAARKWVVARVNTSAVDRFSTVISAAGIDRANYLKNPIVLWEHGGDPARGRVPIGRNAWIKYRPAERDVLAKTFFADDEFSRGLFELYRDEVLRGWSVFVRPSKDPGMTGPPTAAERSARPELATCRTLYRSCELLEYSAVAIPGNVETVTQAVSRGAWFPDGLRSAAAGMVPAPAATPALPPLRGRTMEDVARALSGRAGEAARAMLAEALQDARDLARGRV